MTASITFFPVGNGDMTLVTFDNDQRLLIDMNVSKAADSDDESVPDVMADLRGRLNRDDKGRLFVDGFLLSHPDKDHISGLRAHFHLGPPDSWDKDEDKIFIREMWSSPIVFRRASKSLTFCKDAEAWRDEARRRVALYRKNGQATAEGDRIQIMGDDEGNKNDDIQSIVVKSGEMVTRLNRVTTNAFEARLLAPIKHDDDDEDLEELLDKNHSSVIMRFSMRGAGISDKCRFLTGGDAEVAIWERLWDLYGKDHAEWFSYDILQAPHHCSWHSLSYDSYSECGEKAKVCDNARSSLAQTRKGAIVVASSKVIDPEESDPPSDRAKREYIAILNGHKNQFVCVADIWKNEEHALQYMIQASGITKVVKNAAKVAAGALGIGAIASQPRFHG